MKSENKLGYKYLYTVFKAIHEYIEQSTSVPGPFYILSRQLQKSDRPLGSRLYNSYRNNFRKTYVSMKAISSLNP